MWAFPDRHSATMSEEETVESGKAFLVGTKKDLMEVKRTSVIVDDRVLLVIHHQGVFYAMDQHCYREYFLYWNFSTGWCASCFFFCMFICLFLEFSLTKRKDDWIGWMLYNMLYCVHISLCISNLVAPWRILCFSLNLTRLECQLGLRG